LLGLSELFQLNRLQEQYEAEKKEKEKAKE
jgi:hypothetical protein